MFFLLMALLNQYGCAGTTTAKLAPNNTSSTTSGSGSNSGSGGGGSTGSGGSGSTAHLTNLSWSAENGVDGYFVYRGANTGGPYVRLNSSLETNSSYIDSDVQVGATYYYVVTAVANNVESAYSTEVHATIP